VPLKQVADLPPGGTALTRSAHGASGPWIRHRRYSQKAALLLNSGNSQGQELIEAWLREGSIG
jgi:hypothetical protein